ncbi:MAG: DNA polymerase III subunit delta [Anaerolineaceae bacterium]|nr:DNA polymerase III subunit delta [Anaerolineaceae bacterium]
MPETDKPVIYLLHGDDHFGLMSFIDVLIGKMGNSTTAQMNISRLQAELDSDADIMSACLSMPFLSERRLVILTGLVEKLGKTDTGIQTKNQSTIHSLDHKKNILDFFQSIPRTTALILIVEDEWVRDRGAWGWKVMPGKHWLIAWARNNPSMAYYRVFTLPRGKDMINWISSQVLKMGGQISPPAAQALALAIGNDTQRAHQELDKLLTYVNYERPVEISDVEYLTKPGIDENIFEMADASGRRDGKQALDKLHDLLVHSSAEELFGMVSRQFRLLIIVKEALGTAMTLTEMCGLIKLPAAIVEKYIHQAQGYSLNELKGIYRRLLELDLSNKRSLMPADVALDVFIVSLTTQMP